MTAAEPSATPEFEVRRAVKADAPAIHRCLTAAFDPSFGA